MSDELAFSIITPLLTIALYLSLAYFALSLIFTIAMLVDCNKREFKDRILWFIILSIGLVSGMGAITSIVYYFLIKKKNIG